MLSQPAAIALSTALAQGHQPNPSSTITSAESAGVVEEDPLPMNADELTARSMPGTSGRHLLAADREHDVIEPYEHVLAGGRAQADLDVAGAVDRALVVVEERLPSAPVRCGRGDRQVASEPPVLIEQDDVVGSRDRRGALEPGRARADDRDAAACRRDAATSEERCGGARSIL